jgi:UDP-N-acetylmuramyl pentapeptide phosphotransferase/UDP-N-acetylglucosamine-1-phosphate transferase
LILGIVSAGVVSLALQPLAIRYSRRHGLLDVPNHRSSHSVPTARSGGVVVLGAILLGTSIILTDGTSDAQRPLLLVVVAGVFAFALLGLYDDMHGISPLRRLGDQFVIAGCWAAALLLQPVDARVGNATAVYVVGAVIVVAYVNAFNFMDGVNGIAALNAAVSAATLAFLLNHQDETAPAALAAVVAAAALGFLPWNAPRARIFLGDVGSYGVGASIAVLAVVAVASGADPLLCAAPLFVYGLDTGVTLLRRAVRRDPLTVAHRDHVYQRLVDAGSGHLGAALSCATASGLVCGWAVLMVASGWSGWTMVPVAICVGVAYVALPNLLAVMSARSRAVDNDDGAARPFGHPG